MDTALSKEFHNFPNSFLTNGKSHCIIRYVVTMYGLLAQLVEHIVHIDGVTGSSPVQTTKNS